MRILEHYSTKIATCGFCNCKFEYDEDDIYELFDSCSGNIDIHTAQSIMLATYTYCPFCGMDILVKKHIKHLSIKEFETDFGGLIGVSHTETAESIRRERIKKIQEELHKKLKKGE